MPVAVEQTPDGRRLCVSRSIAAPRERAWTLLTDTDRWPEWGPSVTAAEASERVIQSGTSGHVRTPVGVRVPFEITSCEPHRWTWRVAKIPATGHRVDNNGDSDACRVVFEVPLLAAGYVPVCARALERIEASLGVDSA